MRYGFECELKVIMKYESVIGEKVYFVGFWVDYKFLFFGCFFDNFVGKDIVVEIKVLKIFK